MKRLVACLMAAAVGLAPLSAAALADGARVERQALSDLSEKYDELEDQQKLLENQLGQAKTERDKRLAEIQRLDIEIEAASGQIALLDERIALLETRIARMEAQTERKQQEIDAGYEALRERLRALVRMPRVTNLGIALGTDSYFEFVTSRTIAGRAARYDRELVDGLNAQREALESIRSEIARDRDGVAQDKALVDEKRQQLGRRLAAAQKQVQDIALLEQQFLANREALERQMKQVQQELDDVYAKLRDGVGATYVGGENVFGSMTHPAPALTQITSGYGLRFNRSNFHTGVDFSVAGAYGKDIVAANEGVVAFVNTAFTPGYGYGKYVILDHGGGITTLYGHCSAITAQEGQRVKKGEVIAKVGSTGWSTGPHCHFEVRVNGQHTDPMPYLAKTGL